MATSNAPFTADVAAEVHAHPPAATGIACAGSKLSPTADVEVNPQEQDLARIIREEVMRSLRDG